MSYYFRQRQMQPVEKRGDLPFDRANAQRIWDEAKIVRGKTTPASNSGSFAPAGGDVGAGGAKVNEEVIQSLNDVRALGYGRLSAYRRYTEDSFVAEMKDEMKKRVGPAFGRQTEAMAREIFAEYQRVGPHNNYAPANTARDGLWAQKQGLNSDNGATFNPRLGASW